MPFRAIARVAALTTALVVAMPIPNATAEPDPPVESFAYTSNLEPLGWSPRPNPASGIYNSDLAFWGDIAYQGTYDGFQIIDISDPGNPEKLNDYRECSGTSSSNQGDVIAYEKYLVRGWNSPAGSGALCDGEAVPSGWEGIHIFDVTDPADPDLVGSVATCGGAHTATGVPDPANDRLLVYSNASSTSGGCGGFDVVEIPLDDPGAARVLRHETPEPVRSCHDTAVIFGDAMLAACAGGNGFAVWSLGGERGGSLEDPVQLHSQALSGVTIGHAATFSWDGKTLVFGHEPGGGSGARCQATSATVDKTVFFFETDTFTEVGRWVLPRPQTSAENCTVHNFNVVPTDRANILVSGNYQSGIGIVDFTDPTRPVEIAYADPAPLSPTQLGGDWSTHWYDGTIYESDITRGLLTWAFDDPRVSAAQTLGHLNPQTQEGTMTPVLGDFSIDVGASPAGVQIGEAITYSITATNNGPNSAEAVTVTDPLATALTFDSVSASSGSCAHDGASQGGLVTCDLGTLGVGASATVTLRVTAAGSGFILNTASVTGSLFDAEQDNNSATSSVSINPFPTGLDDDFTVEGDVATVSGNASFPAITMPEAVGGTKTGFSAQAQPAAAAAGLDLASGQVVPVNGGLRFIWGVGDMLPQPGALPEAVRYAWTLQTDAGNIYQLEAKRSSVASVNTAEDPAQHLPQAASGASSFRLKGNCQASYEGTPVSECHHLAYLTGAFDHENNRVTIDWPYETKNAANVVVAPDFKPGATLVNSLFAGMSISGSFQAVTTTNNANLSNYINGWDAYRVGPRVQLGVGPGGIDPSTASYGPAVTLSGGSFTGQVAGVSESNHTVYARACNGERCAYTSRRVV